MRISINDDFDLDKMANSGQCFRARLFDDGTYRFVSGDEIVYIRRAGENEFLVDCREGAWDSVWSDYFDLSRNYRKIRESVPASDEFLSGAAKNGEGLRVLRQEPWETLITFIISQRKSIPAIKGCLEKIAERFGEKIETSRETLYSFPDAGTLGRCEAESLSGCGVGYRLSYIFDAAKKVSGGELDLARLREFGDEELFAALKSVRGVGDKVANCVALFAYGRTSRVPVDTWIARIMNERYGGENPFLRYGEEGGIMQQYAFYYAQTHKKSL